MYEFQVAKNVVVLIQITQWCENDNKRQIFAYFEANLSVFRIFCFILSVGFCELSRNATKTEVKKIGNIWSKFSIKKFAEVTS